MTRDLTQGSVMRTLLLFSLPLLLSTLLQQFYNLADSMIVGRFLGENGLAAIGAAYPITLFFVAVGTGSSMGSSVVISRLFGAGQTDRLRSACFTSMVCFSLLGLLLTAAGITLAGPLMTLLNVPSAILFHTRSYLAICAGGVFALLVYNAASGIFTGLGDSRTPLILLAASSVLNVVLDYAAVRFLRWGVIGTAWATLFSQYVAAALALAILLVRLRRLNGRTVFDKTLLPDLASSAVPCILQQGCVALSHTVLQGLLNGFDTAVIAGYEAASKLHNFVYMSMNTLGTSLSAFTGQCMGASKPKRARQGFFAALMICLGVALIVCALFRLFPHRLISLFIDSEKNPAVIGVGAAYLRFVSLLYFPICCIVTTGGLLRGIGRSDVFFAETVAELLIRIVACFILVRALADYTGLLWGWTAGSCSGGLMCIVISIYVLKKRLNPAKSPTLTH